MNFKSFPRRVAASCCCVSHYAIFSENSRTVVVRQDEREVFAHSAGSQTAGRGLARFSGRCDSPVRQKSPQLNRSPHKSPHSGETQETLYLCKLLITIGGRGGNRTHNIRLRRPVLYPIELLAQTLGTALLYRLVSFHSVDELRCILMMTTGL